MIWHRQRHLRQAATKVARVRAESTASLLVRKRATIPSRSDPIEVYDRVEAVDPSVPVIVAPIDPVEKPAALIVSLPPLDLKKEPVLAEAKEA